MVLKQILKKLFFLFICFLFLGLKQKQTAEIAGTWVSHTKDGYTVIKLFSNANADYAKYIDYEKALPKKLYEELKNSPLKGRPYYYESAGKWSINKFNILSVQTDQFRFDFKITPNGLVEFDKTGDQETFKKMRIDK